MYDVKFSNTAKRQLAKLSKEVRHHIFSVLDRVKTRPESYITKLVGLPAYKIRVGDYRVLLELKENLIFIFKIGHRKDVYDKF